MLSIYPACFARESEGWSVIFPDLNGLATCGGTLEEAMVMAVDCLAGYLYTSRMDGDKIPAPSRLDQLDPASVLSSLTDGEEVPVLESFINLVSVDVSEYAKAHFEKSVKKTLTIPAWLNQAAEQAHVNFSQVLQEALKARLGVQSKP